MRIEQIDILGRNMTAYLPDATQRSYYRDARPAVVIFPGGGYEFTFEGEGEPIALRLAADGVVPFVLSYSCADHPDCGALYPHVVQEAFAAVRHVRENAAKYGIDPHNIATCGFSAGGHLCACTGTLWNKPEAETLFASREEALASRPDKLLLCYAVIRGEEPCLRWCFNHFFGTQDPSREQLKAFSMQERVDAHTPPAFLWATSEDMTVPVAGTLEFAHALAANGVPFEMHIWEHGIHGLCLGNHVTQTLPFGQAMPIERWAAEAVRFLFDQEKTAAQPQE